MVEFYNENGIVAAAYYGQIEAVKELVEVHYHVNEVHYDVNENDGYDLNESDDEEPLDYTALHCAVLNNNLEMVQVLVEAGADINARDAFECTPLLYSVASKNGDVSIAKLLVEKGADVFVRDKNDRSALKLALENRHFEIAKLIVQVITRSGININAQDRTGSTLLMNAVDHGDPEFVKCIIDAGADVNARNTDGKTALAKALDRKDLEVAKVLIEAGAV